MAPKLHSKSFAAIVVITELPVTTEAAAGGHPEALLKLLTESANDDEDSDDDFDDGDPWDSQVWTCTFIGRLVRM